MRIGQCVHALPFRAKESAKTSSAPFIHMKQKSANVKGHFSRSCIFQAYNERMTLSVCMIVRDEEKVLSRCLESLRSEADELIIVDTGSRDKTAEIARKYTDRVYFFPWIDDFSAARNFAFSKASGDYLMWLDADDVIPENMINQLRKLKQRLLTENADMAVCRYVGGGCAYFRERIVKRSAGFHWEGRVHECITPHGKLIRDDFTVVHLGSDKPRGARNLHIYQKWRAEEALSGRDLFYYGRELYYNRLYTESIAILEEMLAGNGWYVNKIEACKILAECHSAQKRPDLARDALLYSFRYGLPRGGICHALGRNFQEAGQYREAIFWYERALACPDRSGEGDFDLPDERTLFPLLGLTYCHYALGEEAAARACHARAAALAPDHPSVAHNEAFFAQQKSPQIAGSVSEKTLKSSEHSDKT